jgi:hypothetical protein
MKQIFFHGFQGGNSSSARCAAFDITFESARRSLFAKYRRICGVVRSDWIAKELDFVATFPSTTLARVHAYVRDLYRRVTADGSSMFDNKIGSAKSLRFFLASFSIPSWFSITGPTPFGIQSLCMSFLWIILAVYRSRADCAIATRIIERTLRYRKLLILLLGRRYEIDL